MLLGIGPADWNQSGTPASWIEPPPSDDSLACAVKGAEHRLRQENAVPYSRYGRSQGYLYRARRRVTCLVGVADVDDGAIEGWDIRGDVGRIEGI